LQTKLLPPWRSMGTKSGNAKGIGHQDELHHRRSGSRSVKQTASNDALLRTLGAFSQGDAGQIKMMLELGQEITQALTGTSQKQRTESTDLARDLLECSKKDIQAAQLLYEGQVLPLSIYHLQQAVEKATKAYALAFCVITKDELTTINHRSPMAYIRMLRKSWVRKFIVALKMLYPDVNTNVREAKKVLVSNNTEQELAKLPESVIRTLLDLNEKIRVILTSDETRNQIYTQIEIALNSLESLLPDANTEETIGFLRTNFRFDLACFFGSLFILSVVTYPHWMFTRYPDKQLKPSDYSSDLGVVRCMGGILAQVQHAIHALEEELSQA
jgi:hypothetical protein